jgi:uncharacterized protein (TIGR03067 family)
MMRKFVFGAAVASLVLVGTVGADTNPAPTAKMLDGAWTVVCYEKDGKAQPDAAGMTVKAEGGTVTCSGKDGKAALTLRLVLGANGTVQVTETGADSSAPAAAARAGVYVLTRDYLAISVNEEVGGTNPRPAAVDGQGGKARCSVILRREAARPGSEK